MSILIIIVDGVGLFLNYHGPARVAMSFRAFEQTVKLKVEFGVLNRLVKFLGSPDGQGRLLATLDMSSSSGNHTDSGTGVGLCGDSSGTTISVRQGAETVTEVAMEEERTLSFRFPERVLKGLNNASAAVYAQLAPRHPGEWTLRCVAFYGIALYNVLQLLFWKLVFFKRYHGLYFWSILVEQSPQHF
ncbi:hypothetical protein BJX70DRAFT_397234 [Aspergillus crustosus]